MEKLKGLDLAKDVITRNIEECDRKIQWAKESIDNLDFSWDIAETLAYRQELRRNTQIVLNILEREVPLEDTVKRLSDRLEAVKENLMRGPEINSSSLISNGINHEKYKANREHMRDLEGILRYIND